MNDLIRQEVNPFEGLDPSVLVPSPGKLIPLNNLNPNTIPWLNRPVSTPSAYRYAKGRRGVKLRTVRGVGGLCTTAEWLWEFFERLNGAGESARPAPSAHRTASQVERAVKRAEDSLNAAGI